MTKEEIFDKEVGEYHRTLSPANYSNVCTAMDQYAKQESIAFAEWMGNHELDFQPTHIAGTWIGVDMEKVTTEEPYTKFITPIK